MYSPPVRVPQHRSTAAHGDGVPGLGSPGHSGPGPLPGHGSSRHGTQESGPPISAHAPPCVYGTTTDPSTVRSYSRDSMASTEYSGSPLVGGKGSGPVFGLQELEEGHHLRMQEHQIMKRNEVNQQELRDVDVDAANKIKQYHMAQQKTFEEALGVDAAGMNEANSIGRIIAAVSLSFLIVVVGCEIDLYGFAMSFNDYWVQDIIVVRALLVIGPFGYILAACMYMYYCSEEQERINRQRSENVAQQHTHTMGGLNGRGHQSAQPTPDSKPELLRRESVHMKYYHFLPVCRYYVVVKEKEADDVESIFRVNSLSSFSLGIAQIVGLLFHSAVKQQPLTIFHKINIISQGINWLITLLYFATPAASYMKAVIKVDAMRYNDTEYLRQLQEKYAELRLKSANPRNSQASEELQELLYNLDSLILGLAGCTSFSQESLAPLDTDWKFDVLKRLFTKKVARYAKA